MISYVRLIIRTLPWILIIVLVVYVLLTQGSFIKKSEGNTILITDVVLEKTQSLGKIELSKYYFKEITEIKKEGNSYTLLGISIGKLKDSKAVLISTGEAAGCIDLLKIKKDHIVNINDTIYISLPEPEICYYKIDLDRSRIYDMQTTYLTEDERRKMVESLYKEAEAQLKEAAMNSEMMTDTRENGIRLLGPLFKEIAGKPVILSFPANLEQDLEIR